MACRAPAVLAAALLAVAVDGNVLGRPSLSSPTSANSTGSGDPMATAGATSAAIVCLRCASASVAGEATRATRESLHLARSHDALARQHNRARFGRRALRLRGKNGPHEPLSPSGRRACGCRNDQSGGCCAECRRRPQLEGVHRQVGHAARRHDGRRVKGLQHKRRKRRKPVRAAPQLALDQPCPAADARAGRARWSAGKARCTAVRCMVVRCTARSMRCARSRARRTRQRCRPLAWRRARATRSLVHRSSRSQPPVSPRLR